MRTFRSWQEYLKWLHAQLPLFTQALARSREASSVHHRLRRQALGSITVPDIGGISSALNRTEAAVHQASLSLSRMEDLKSTLEDAIKVLESGSEMEDTAEIERQCDQLMCEVKHLQALERAQNREIDLHKQHKASVDLQIAETNTKIADTELRIERMKASRSAEMSRLEREIAETEARNAAIAGERERLAALVASSNLEIAALQADKKKKSEAVSSISLRNAELQVQLHSLQLEASRLETETQSTQRSTENLTRKNVSLLLQTETAAEEVRTCKEALTKQLEALELQETSIEEMPYRYQCIQRDYQRRLKLVATFFRKRCVLQTWRCRSVESREVRETLERLKREEELWAEAVRKEVEEQKRKEKGKKKPKKRSKKTSLPAKLASRQTQELEQVDSCALVTSFRQMDR